MIGHSRIREQFTRLITQQQLSHAYILVGAEHIGKETLATWVSAQILHITETAAEHHPDILWVRRGYDEKNERFKRDITISEIREAIQFANESSFYGGHKVIIITDADRLNTEAGNALLKVLEEPPANTIFFLLYKTVGAIIPTIRSRAQLIPLSLVADSELQAAISAIISDPEQVTTICRAAAGRPGLALLFCNDPEQLHSRIQAQTEFLQLIGAPLAEKFAVAEQVTASTQENGGVDALVTHLENWQEATRTALASPNQLLLDYVRVSDEITVAITALRQNAHPRLTIEALFTKIP